MAGFECLVIWIWGFWFGGLWFWFVGLGNRKWVLWKQGSYFGKCITSSFSHRYEVMCTSSYRKWHSSNALWDSHPLPLTPHHSGSPHPTNLGAIDELTLLKFLCYRVVVGWLPAGDVVTWQDRLWLITWRGILLKIPMVEMGKEAMKFLLCANGFFCKKFNRMEPGNDLISALSFFLYSQSHHPAPLSDSNLSPVLFYFFWNLFMVTTFNLSLP